MTWERSDKISACALAAALVALGLQGLQAAPTVEEHFFPEANCDEPGDLIKVPFVEAEATSELAAEGPFSYEAGNAVDGDWTTAWIPAGGDGGVGSRLTLRLPEPSDVQLLCVVNGYLKDARAYERNARARDVTVATEAGDATGALQNHPPDESGAFQELPLRRGTTTHIGITVNSYYSGTYSDSQDPYDLAISEVSAYVDQR